jgi:glutamyl-tRNA reductase
MIRNNWQLVVCGISHKTARLEQREPLQIGREEIARANKTLCNIRGVKESAILSTCNRVEFHFVSDKTRKPIEIVSSFYREFSGKNISDLESSFYIRKNRHAAVHLFRVTAGIDSMVLGENQILGQAKEAYSSACAVKSAGKIIHRLFHQAFRVGKQVRYDTELGKGACSVSSATIEMLKTRMDGLKDPAILFVGFNQMILLAVENLSRLGYKRFYFANRTEQKAIDLAAKYNASGYSLTMLPDLLQKVDVVISCTGSDQPIVKEQLLADRSAAMPDKPLLVADLAIPRDVEMKNSYPGIELYDLEDVRKFVKDQQAQREHAVGDAEEIIEKKLNEFVYWLEHVLLEPAYNGLEDTFEQIRRQEIDEVLDSLPSESREAIDRATRRMVEKFLQIKIRSSSKTEKMEQ